MPGGYHFLAAYKTSTGEHLKTKKDVASNLGDLTIYMPTSGHLILALKEAIELRSVSKNPFGFEEAVLNPSRLRQRRFNQVMEYKQEIRNIVNRELYSKFTLMFVRKSTFMQLIYF